MKWIKTLATALEAVLFPPLCIGCEKLLLASEEVLCLHCQSDLPYTHFHLFQHNPVAKAFWGRLPFSQANALFYFQKKGKIQKLIHQMKYHRHPEIGVYLGKFLASTWMPAGIPHPIIDCILPVPLHPKKERQRGYNQSERIAQGLAQVLQVPLYTDLLIRSKSGQSQTRKNRFQRFQTMQNVFTVNFQKVEQIANKHVLLVDDVITSGSTLEACGNCLWENQIKALSLTAVAYSKG